MVLDKPVLAIETATLFCSVALRMPDGAVFEERAEGKGVHSELTFVFIRQLLDRKKLLVPDLGMVIISAGPGSYTGLRVASSAVKGLLFSSNIPLLSCTTMASIAVGARCNISGEKSSAVRGCDTVIDARRNHLYHQSWSWVADGLVPDSEIQLLELGEVLDRWLQGRLIVGTGLERLTEMAKLQGADPGDLITMPPSNVISAVNLLKADELISKQKKEFLLKKVAPEQFEPYYYSHL
ncbi:MAG: tRNA (adenosine(37)-N6)-threonylcarbamoyltransferase complex dimerization subunit type 1 TsaB [Balneolales bacterium]